MSATQAQLFDEDNEPNFKTETVRLYEIMPVFTDWRNHPNNPDNDN